jgi:hypothetical protein
MRRSALLPGPARLLAVPLAVLLLTNTGVCARSAAFPLRVSADHRHLEDCAGVPFLVVGDTAWSLIAQLDEHDIARYLDDRARRGFNAVIVNLIEHKFASHAPANRGGISPFLAPGNFTQLNPAYFDYAHRALAQAAQRGISAWLCPAYLGWDGGDEGFFKEIKAAGRDALRQYGRFIGERFKDLPNVVWMMGGDYALPPSERWAGDALAAGLRDGGARQLMTAHGGQTAAVETFGDQDWIAVDTVYSYLADLRAPLRAAYLRRPIRPFVLIETTYEGEHDARPEQIRRQAWTAMLSGAGGQFFGNNPIWHFDGPTLFPFAGDWRQALESVGARDMTRLGAWFAGRRWADLAPDLDETIVTVSSGSGPMPVAARTPDGRLAVVYVPADGNQPRDLTVNLHALASAVTAKWFNPARDASSIDEGAVRTVADAPRLRTPGDNGTGVNDWVLMLEAR